MKTKDFPERIEIEFTNKCNSKCIYCPRQYGVGDEGVMPFYLFKKIIDEAEQYAGIALQLHRRGESLLHPEFEKMLEYLRGKFNDVQLATNAILLDKKKAESIAEAVTFLSFSIDLPESFHRKRGVDVYPLVEKNISHFLDINRKTRTQVSMVCDDTTRAEDLERFKALWLDKVDRVRVYEEHSVGGAYGATRNRRAKRSTCMKPFNDVVIYWDGNVVRCNHDWSNKPLGDIRSGSIAGIWHGAEFDRVRKEQSALDFTDDICKTCDSWYPEAGKQETGYVFARSFQ